MVEFVRVGRCLVPVAAIRAIEESPIDGGAVTVHYVNGDREQVVQSQGVELVKWAEGLLVKEPESAKPSKPAEPPAPAPAGKKGITTA